MKLHVKAALPSKIPAIQKKNVIKWIETYIDLSNWVNANGKFPYSKSKDNSERRLGDWLINQRGNYNVDSSSFERLFKDVPFDDQEKQDYKVIIESFKNRKEALENFKKGNETINLLSEEFTVSQTPFQPWLTLGEWCKVIEDFLDKTKNNPHYPSVNEATELYGPKGGKKRTEKDLAAWLNKIVLGENKLKQRGNEIPFEKEQFEIIKKIKDLGQFSEALKKQKIEAFKDFWKETKGRYPTRYSDQYPQSDRYDPPKPNKYGKLGLTEYQLYNFFTLLTRNNRVKEDPDYAEIIKECPQVQQNNERLKSGRVLFANFLEKWPKNFLEAYKDLISYNNGATGCDFYKTDNNTKLFFYEVKSYNTSDPQLQRAQEQLKELVEELYKNGVNKEILKFEIIKIKYKVEKEKLNLTIEFPSTTLLTVELTFEELREKMKTPNISRTYLDYEIDSVIYFLKNLITNPESGGIRNKIYDTRNSAPLIEKTKNMIYNFLKDKYKDKDLFAIIYSETSQTAKLRLSRWIKQ